MALICDTSVILAALDLDDPDHHRCAKLIDEAGERLIVPGLALAELDYWCSESGLRDAWHTFVEDLGLGAWRVEWPTSRDVLRAHGLGLQYEDLRIGLVDGTIVALGERLGEPKLATLDFRHFSVVRPLHVPAFEILPS